MNNRNARFSRRSTFVCQTCGHMTREAGENNGLDLCPICAELAGLENTLSDDGDENFRNSRLPAVVNDLVATALRDRSESHFAKLVRSFDGLIKFSAASVEVAPAPAPAPVAKKPGHYTKAELVEIVKENARKRYEKGGHLIIETMTDEKIAEYIGSSTTAKGAIFWVWKRGCVHEVHDVWTDRMGA